MRTSPKLKTVLMKPIQLEWCEVGYAVIAVGSVMAVVFVLFVGFFAYGWRESEHAEACSANLKMISQAKYEYAVDHHLKEGGVVPDGALWAIGGWIKNEPECANEGRYTVGRIGEPPTCSVGGEHSVFAKFSQSGE
jgi:hypothetical protein